MRKKLIEVALPLEAINQASAREKSIRHGHPSTLHLWWARRPLAACRAVLFASFVDDPDHDPMFAGREELAQAKRAELFDLIEQLVQWGNSHNPEVIDRARAEIARCVASQKVEAGQLAPDEILKLEPANPAADDTPIDPCTPGELMAMSALPRQVDAFLAGYAPPVLDPFCGGGSIPLEAQRLGLRAYGSDLNPVPVLITKALIEIPPRFANQPPVHPGQSESPVEKRWHAAQGLAEDLRYYGNWMRDEAERRIGSLYPKIKVTEDLAEDRPDLKAYAGQELTVVAWIWARTVVSPNPAAAGKKTPLLRSFQLCRKSGKEAWLAWKTDADNNQPVFTVHRGVPPANVDEYSVGRRGSKCLYTGSPVPLRSLQTEGQAQRLGSQLVAIVAAGRNERVYMSPTAEHELISRSAPTCSEPAEELSRHPQYMGPPRYGITQHRHLFSNRQLAALMTFSGLVGEAAEQLRSQPAGKRRAPQDEYAKAVALLLSFSVSKSVDYWSTMCSWHSSKELIRNSFGRQAISMVWDFAEANPFHSGTGGFGTGWSEKIIGRLGASCPGRAGCADARDATEQLSSYLLSTDPPYYDNVPYADLSDVFYVWLRRSIGPLYRDICSPLLTPKADELVADVQRLGGTDNARDYFEAGMQSVFAGARRQAVSDYPLTVFYAFKQAETRVTGSSSDISTAATGWETMLQGLISAGLVVQATWPLRTEMPNRMRGLGFNALASSIVLACRPRPADAPKQTRRGFLAELRRELPEALRKLQEGNIAPVDLAQAAIGPGMAVFSQYSQVLEADGSPLRVRTALELVNQMLDDVLAEQEGEFDAETRWAIAWFEQHAMNEGPFGSAEMLATAKNVSIKTLEQAGLLKAKVGKVRLLNRSEYSENWPRETGDRPPLWQRAQQLIHTLETQGETGAAQLLSRLKEADALRDLAYRLYTTCERKKWAREALAYNSLVIAWPEIVRLSHSVEAGT